MATVHAAARITASSLFRSIPFCLVRISLSLFLFSSVDKATNNDDSGARGTNGRAKEERRKNDGTERGNNSVDEVERVFKLSAPSSSPPSSSVMPTFNARSFLLLLFVLPALSLSLSLSLSFVLRAPPPSLLRPQRPPGPLPRRRCRRRGLSSAGGPLHTRRESKCEVEV